MINQETKQSCDCPPFDCRSLDRQSRAGDYDATAKLIAHFEPLMREIVKRVMGAALSCEVDEAAHDVSSSVLSKTQMWPEDYAFCKWLKTSAVNEAIDRKRYWDTREQIRPVSGIDLANQMARSPTDEVANVIECFEEKAEKLPEDLRLIYKLHFKEGHGRKEVAIRLAIAVSTVDTKLSRIREALRPCLDA